MRNFFIDKLNVVQDHYDNRLKYVGTDLLIRVDLQTGDERESPTKLQLEGSYSSSLMVRCNGSRVEVYGNPSRYQRIDNLFGLTTFDECIAVYNQVLLKLGLPPFTKCTRLMSVQNTENQVVNWIADGACIKHVDFTINHVVGQGNEQTYIRGLSSHSLGRSIQPYIYPDGFTVDWFGKNLTQNGSTHRYVKCYTKSVDLLRHQKKINRVSSKSDQVYYQKIIDLTKKLGVIRDEHSFKNRWLKEHNLFAYGLVKEYQFKPFLTCIDDIRKRLEVTPMDPLEVERELIELEVVNTSSAAQATTSFFLYWMAGKTFKRNSQYYVHKSRLLELGIDISVPCDLSRTIRFRNLELIDVKPLEIPDWYRMPAKTHLKLVA